MLLPPPILHQFLLSQATDDGRGERRQGTGGQGMPQPTHSVNSNGEKKGRRGRGSAGEQCAAFHVDTSRAFPSLPFSPSSSQKRKKKKMRREEESESKNKWNGETTAAPIGMWMAPLIHSSPLCCSAVLCCPCPLFAAGFWPFLSCLFLLFSARGRQTRFILWVEGGVDLDLENLWPQRGPTEAEEEDGERAAEKGGGENMQREMGKKMHMKMNE